MARIIDASEFRAIAAPGLLLSAFDGMDFGWPCRFVDFQEFDEPPDGYWSFWVRVVKWPPGPVTPVMTEAEVRELHGKGDVFTIQTESLEMLVYEGDDENSMFMVFDEGDLAAFFLK